MKRAELILGWLAAVLFGGEMVYIFVGGFVAPQSAVADLVLFGGIAVLLAVGVTLDTVRDSLAGRWLLTLATLAMLGLTAISFLASLFVPAVAALLAAIFAYVRPRERHPVPVR